MINYLVINIMIPVNGYSASMVFSWLQTFPVHNNIMKLLHIFKYKIWLYIAFILLLKTYSTNNYVQLILMSRHRTMCSKKVAYDFVG